MLDYNFFISGFLRPVFLAQKGIRIVKRTSHVFIQESCSETIGFSGVTYACVCVIPRTEYGNNTELYSKVGRITVCLFLKLKFFFSDQNSGTYKFVDLLQIINSRNKFKIFLTCFLWNTADTKSKFEAQSYKIDLGLNYINFSIVILIKILFFLILGTLSHNPQNEDKNL